MVWCKKIFQGTLIEHMRVQNIVDLTSFASTNVNVVYYNDLHGQTNNIDGFLVGQQEFYKNNPKDINLTLSGGDIFLDTSRGNEKIAEKLVSSTDAVALGNHDLEGGIDYLSRLVKQTNTAGKYLSANLDIISPPPTVNRI